MLGSMTFGALQREKVQSAVAEVDKRLGPGRDTGTDDV